ncbi:MAG: chemotaxis protein CheW [Candidatus Sericytochromatia bacterium]
MPEIIIQTQFPAQEQLLRKRTEELAHQVNQAQNQATSTHAEWIFFASAGVQCALERQFVTEVHMEVRPVRVPRTPAFAKGIVNLRGDIVSTIDLNLVMDCPPLPVRSSYTMMRLRAGALEFGVLVEEILDIRPLDITALHPFEHAQAPGLNRYLLGVTRDMINVLDARILMSDERLLVR